MERADLALKIFFSKSENNFEAGSSGFKADGFLCASPEQKNTSFDPRKARLKITS
jgi:hypothetical protein